MGMMVLARHAGRVSTGAWCDGETRIDMKNEREFLTAELAHYGVVVDWTVTSIDDAWQALADQAVAGVRAHAV